MTTSAPHIVKPSDALEQHARALEAAPRPVSKRARGSRDRGIAIIEFAFVFPILLIMLFCIIDFGIYFLDQHTMQFATREGARVGLVGRQLTDPGGAVLSREQSIVQTIRNYAKIALDPNKVSVSIYPVEAPNFTDPAGWKGTLDAGDPGAYMRVRTQFTYKFIIPYLSDMFGGPLVIQAEATYRNESF